MSESIDDKKIHIAFRIEKSEYDCLVKFAEKDFEGNFSMAVRQVLRAGIKALKI